MPDRWRECDCGRKIEYNETECFNCKREREDAASKAEEDRIREQEQLWKKIRDA